MASVSRPRIVPEYDFNGRKYPHLYIYPRQDGQTVCVLFLDFNPEKTTPAPHHEPLICGCTYCPFCMLNSKKKKKKEIFIE